MKWWHIVIAVALWYFGLCLVDYVAKKKWLRRK